MGRCAACVISWKQIRRCQSSKQIARVHKAVQQPIVKRSMIIRVTYWNEERPPCGWLESEGAGSEADEVTACISPQTSRIYLSVFPLSVPYTLHGPSSKSANFIPFLILLMTVVYDLLLNVFTGSDVLSKQRTKWLVFMNVKLSVRNRNQLCIIYTEFNIIALVFPVIWKHHRCNTVYLLLITRLISVILRGWSYYLPLDIINLKIIIKLWKAVKVVHIVCCSKIYLVNFITDHLIIQITVKNFTNKQTFFFNWLL
jgi:hypothetical protein